jgi:hypothetical protein
MAISIPQLTKRAGQDTFINVSPSMQGDKTFHYGKRIPPAITKLRESSAYVKRHPGQAGTACDFWEQTVTLLETIPFRRLTLVVFMTPTALSSQTMYGISLV